jgi:hypothetical protein
MRSKPKTVPFWLIPLLLTGCSPLQQAGENLMAAKDEILVQATEAAVKIVENPSLSTALAEIGGFGAYLATVALGGLALRNKKSNKRKAAMEERLAELERGGGGG